MCVCYSIYSHFYLKYSKKLVNKCVHTPQYSELFLRDTVFNGAAVKIWIVVTRGVNRRLNSEKEKLELLSQD